MKKTLIALLALAGVTCADTATQMNDALDGMLTGYTAGDSYTLEISLTNHNTANNAAANLVTLSGGWYLRNQVGNYLAFWESGDPVWKNSDVSVDGTTTSLTLSEPTSVWFSNTINANGAATGGSLTLNGATITISYDAAVKATEISLTRANGNSTITNILTINNYEAKATDIAFQTMSGSVVSFSSTPTPAVPEPATATLSLLALAGLAARRRRK